MTGNQFKQRLKGIHSGLSALKSAAAEKFDLAGIAEYTVRFLLGMLLSQARIFGDLSPFAVGLSAAAGPGGPGIATLLGVIPGYLFGGLGWSLKYTAAAVLIFTAWTILRDAAPFEKSWFAPAAASGVFAVTGLAYLYAEGITFHSFASFAAEAALCALSAWLYHAALSPWRDTGSGDDLLHTVSLMMLAGSVFIALSSLKLFGIISVGRSFAVLTVMVAACKGGLTAGCAAGVVIGACMDAAENGTAFFTILYGVCGLSAGLLARRGRLAFTLLHVLTGGLASLWLSPSPLVIPSLYETFIASVLFLLLPGSVMAKLGAIFPGEPTGYGVMKAREYTRARVELTAEAFRTLYDTVRTAVGNEAEEDDLSTVFDRASESVCRKCSLSRRCWKQEYESTLDVMNTLTNTMNSRGRITTEDYPVFFAEGCQHLQEFTASLNEELKALYRRRLYRSRLRQRQDAAYRQYEDMASILGDIAGELGGGILFDTAMERRFQKYLRTLDIDASAAVFRDRAGRLHIELSGQGLISLRRDVHYLDKLSAVAGCRLCAALERSTARSMVLLEAEPYAVTVGIANLCREGQPVSGDRGTWFKTDEGYLYVILSDGMGSGEPALQCSTGTVKTLESFLRAGISAETALRILSDLMLLKNESDTICATIDLMAINLFTGDARLYKYGAAPTYIHKSGYVRRLKSRNLAAGLASSSEDAPVPVKLKLESGAKALILSDGVLCGKDDTWLRELLASDSLSGAKDLAKAVLESSAERFGAGDDMTVLALALETRK